MCIQVYTGAYDKLPVTLSTVDGLPVVAGEPEADRQDADGVGRRLTQEPVRPVCGWWLAVH